MYDSLEAELHDLFWDQEGTSIEIDFINEILSSKPPAHTSSEGKIKSLEIGCGSGRLLIPLLEKGHHIDGVDTSADMINLLESNLTDTHPHLLSDIITHHGKTEEMELSCYDHFLIPAFTIQLMPDPAAFLKHLHAHSKDQCSLYLTTFIPWAEIAGELEEEDWYADHSAVTTEGQTAQCRTQFTIDRTQQKLYRKHEYQLSGGSKKSKTTNRTHSTTQDVTWFYYKELLNLLTLTGWDTTKTIFDFDPSSDGENAHLLTIFANKS